MCVGIWYCWLVWFCVVCLVWSCGDLVCVLGCVVGCRRMVFWLGWLVGWFVWFLVIVGYVWIRIWCWRICYGLFGCCVGLGIFGWDMFWKWCVCCSVFLWLVCIVFYWICGWVFVFCWCWVGCCGLVVGWVLKCFGGFGYWNGLLFILCVWYWIGWCCGGGWSFCFLLFVGWLLVGLVFCLCGLGGVFFVFGCIVWWCVLDLVVWFLVFCGCWCCVVRLCCYWLVIVLFGVGLFGYWCCCSYDWRL